MDIYFYPGPFYNLILTADEADVKEWPHVKKRESLIVIRQVKCP
jgi:hypothetical protein